MKSKVVRNLSSEFDSNSPHDSGIELLDVTPMEQLQGHDNSTRETSEFTPYPKPTLEPPIEDDGLPKNPIWEIARKETNALKMKFWAEKRERWAKFGYGSEPELHHAINPKEKPCEFEGAAETVMQQNLGVVERYAVAQYVKELRERERSAVGLARMYRNKFEESQAEKVRSELTAVLRQQEQRQFYRNSIQEGGTRAGLMLKLAKEKAQNRYM